MMRNGVISVWMDGEETGRRPRLHDAVFPLNRLPHLYYNSQKDVCIEERKRKNELKLFRLV